MLVDLTKFTWIASRSRVDSQYWANSRHQINTHVGGGSYLIWEEAATRSASSPLASLPG